MGTLNPVLSKEEFIIPVTVELLVEFAETNKDFLSKDKKYIVDSFNQTDVEEFASMKMSTGAKPYFSRSSLLEEINYFVDNGIPVPFILTLLFAFLVTRYWIERISVVQ